MTFDARKQNSMTFQAWKMKSLNSMTFQVFQDLYEPCYLSDHPLPDGESWWSLIGGDCF